MVGDERSIETAFPQNWHEPESLRGVPCRCDVKVNELFEWDLPEVRAAFLTLCAKAEGSRGVPCCFATSISRSSRGATSPWCVAAPCSPCPKGHALQGLCCDLTRT